MQGYFTNQKPPRPDCGCYNPPPPCGHDHHHDHDNCDCDCSKGCFETGASVLVDRIVDTIRCRETGCLLNIPMPCLPHACCVSFVSACVTGKAELCDIKLDSAYQRAGCRISATVLVQISVTLSVDGCEKVFRSEVCIPISSIVRAPLGQVSKWVVQFNATLYNGQLQCDTLVLCMDYEAIVYAVSPCVMKFPVSTPPPQCPPFPPLYPR